MYYQIEIFYEYSKEDMQEELNKFLLLLTADRIKDIRFETKSLKTLSGEYEIIYIAYIIYTYGK